MVASAFYYNASLAMGALAQAGAVQAAFSAWLAGVNGRGKRFRRMYDKKVRACPLFKGLRHAASLFCVRGPGKVRPPARGTPPCGAAYAQSRCGISA